MSQLTLLKESLEQQKLNLNEKVREKEEELDQKISELYKTEEEANRIKDESQKYREKCVKLENDNLNLEQRLSEKDSELHKLKGELSAMDRVLKNVGINQPSNKESEDDFTSNNHNLGRIGTHFNPSFQNPRFSEFRYFSRKLNFI